MSTLATLLPDAALAHPAEQLLAKANIGEGVALERLAEGANNCVLRIGDSAVLKCYYRHDSDQRDRYTSEKAFYQWCQAISSDATPTPLAWDDAHRLGLFTLAEGQKLTAGAVDDDALAQALDFIKAINSDREQAATRNIPDGAESCFCAGDHLAVVHRRMARVQQITADDAASTEAVKLINEELLPAWRHVRETATSALSVMESSLPKCQRCLSPSDFGFHNALRDTAGKLRFFDFEYAGWDDPAKLACDFFCQPQVPVPLAQWGRVTRSLQETLDLPETFTTRAAALLPVYRLKWCCIMLNVFLHRGSDSRRFARANGVTDAERHKQLEKVRNSLKLL